MSGSEPTQPWMLQYVLLSVCRHSWQVCHLSHVSVMSAIGTTQYEYTYRFVEDDAGTVRAFYASRCFQFNCCMAWCWYWKVLWAYGGVTPKQFAVKILYLVSSRVQLHLYLCCHTSPMNQTTIKRQERGSLINYLCNSTHVKFTNTLVQYIPSRKWS